MHDLRDMIETGDHDGVDRYLASKPVDLNLPDSSRLSPLAHAVDVAGDSYRQRGIKIELRTIRSLLAAGADPDFSPDGRTTPRQLAAHYEYPELCVLFGVEPNPATSGTVGDRPVE